MSYITPNSIIKILRGVPLDSDYNYSLFFANATAQYNTLNAYTVYTFNNQSYQRYGKNKLRVQINPDNVHNCNYLMFQNTSYGNKWFYAFIMETEYVNDNVVEITYKIDCLMTYNFDYLLKPCFVERNHANVDTIGSNIEPENVEVGEYIFNDYSGLLDLSDYSVIIAIVDTQGTTVDGNVYSKVYSGATLYHCSVNEVNQINNFLANYVQSPDSVVGMYMCPSLLVGGSSATVTQLGNSAISRTIQKTPASSSMSLDGYTPKNKKLYTYPYNFYHVDDGGGHELTLRYEFFENLQPSLNIKGVPSQPIEITLKPIKYKGVGDYDPQNNPGVLNTESLVLNNFPMCSWNCDSYKAWIAQNGIPELIDLGVGVGSLSIATAFMNPFAVASSGMSLLQTTGNILKSNYKASIAADICNGSFSNGGVAIRENTKQFFGGRCSLTAGRARSIDDYFTMFGYAMNRIQVPQRYVRERWTYVKTDGCILVGNLPMDAEKEICSAYDKGITWWVNASEVGNYNLSNNTLV